MRRRARRHFSHPFPSRQRRNRCEDTQRPSLMFALAGKTSERLTTTTHLGAAGPPSTPPTRAEPAPRPHTHGRRASQQVNRESDGFIQQTVPCLTGLMKNCPEAETTSIDQEQPNKRSLHLIVRRRNISWSDFPGKTETSSITRSKGNIWITEFSCHKYASNANLFVMLLIWTIQ